MERKLYQGRERFFYSCVDGRVYVEVIRYRYYKEGDIRTLVPGSIEKCYYLMRDKFCRLCSKMPAVKYKLLTNKPTVAANQDGTEIMMSHIFVERDNRYYFQGKLISYDGGNSWEHQKKTAADGNVSYVEMRSIYKELCDNIKKSEAKPAVRQRPVTQRNTRQDTSSQPRQKTEEVPPHLRRQQQAVKPTSTKTAKSTNPQTIAPIKQKQATSINAAQFSESSRNNDLELINKYIAAGKADALPAGFIPMAIEHDFGTVRVYLKDGGFMTVCTRESALRDPKVDFIDVYPTIVGLTDVGLDYISSSFDPIWNSSSVDKVLEPIKLRKTLYTYFELTNRGKIQLAD